MLQQYQHQTRILPQQGKKKVLKRMTEHCTKMRMKEKKNDWMTF